VAAPCSQWIACSPVRKRIVHGRSTRSLDRSMDATSPLPPTQVRRAIALLWTSAGLCALQLVAMSTGLLKLPEGTTLGADDIAGNLVNIALLGIIAWKILQRRQWARWVLFALVSFGVLSAIFSILAIPEIWQSASMPFYVLMFIHTLLQLVATGLLFTPEGKSWFGGNDAAV
jgi:hypothetical protein